MVKRTEVTRTVSPALITGESIIKLSTQEIQETQCCVFNKHSTLLYKLKLTFYFVLFCFLSSNGYSQEE